MLIIDGIPYIEGRRILANDSTAALTVRQDGAGKLLSLLDGATAVFEILDGGGITSPVNSETLTASKTLVVTDKAYQMLDPAAASYDVTLPTPATGTSFVIKHKGTANTLVVKRADATTLVTLAVGERVTCVYDGAAWQEI